MHDGAFPQERKSFAKFIRSSDLHTPLGALLPEHYVGRRRRMECWTCVREQATDVMLQVLSPYAEQHVFSK